MTNSARPMLIPPKKKKVLLSCVRKLCREAKGGTNLQTTLSQENREELVEYEIGHVLPLRTHADGLRTHIHGEDLGRPNPGRGSPRWLIEEDEQEEQERKRDANGLVFGEEMFGTICTIWRGETGGCESEHADCHSDTSYDEEEFASVAVSGPNGVQGEENTTGAINCVDEIDGIGTFVNSLVDLTGVAIECSLTSKLLTAVDNESDPETFADGGISPEGLIGTSCVGFLLVFDSFADGEKFVLDFLLSVADAHKSRARFLDLVPILDIPTRGFRNEWKERHYDEGDQHLEYDDEFPVPLSKGFGVFTGCKGDPTLSVSKPSPCCILKGCFLPVSKERSDGVEHLPECHDLTTDLSWCQLSDINWTGSLITISIRQLSKKEWKTYSKRYLGRDQ